MSESITQQQQPTGELVLSPDQQALLSTLAEAANQQDRARAASGLPTRVGQAIWGVASDIAGGIREAPGQIVRGATEALDSAASGLRAAVGATGLVSDEFMASNPATPVAPNVAPEASTVTGGIVNDVSQFVAGLIPAGRILKLAGGAAKVVQAGAGVGEIAVGGMVKAAAHGAIADFVAFDPHEERLSNLIEKYPALHNPVTEFLAAKPEDSEALGRFKNVIEGLGLGAAADGLIRGLGLLRAARKGDKAATAAAADELDKAAPKGGPADPVDILAQDRRAQPQPEAPTGGKAEEKVQSTAPSPDQPELDLQGGSSPHPDSPAAEVKANPTADPTPHRNAAPKLIEVDDAGLREVVQQNLRETGFGQGRSISGIRTDLIESGEDIASMMNSLRVVYREELDKAIGGKPGGGDFPVRSLEDVRKNADRLADVLGDDPDLFWQRMSSIHGTTKNLDAELLVYRDMLATVHDKTRRLAEAINDPTGTATAGYKTRVELMNQFQRHVELAANVQVAYKGIQTNVARALNSMRLPSKLDPALLKHGADAFFEGGEDAIKRMAAKVAASGDLTAFNNVVRGGWVRNAIGAVNEYWINSVLSGPKTHAVNMMSNSLTTILQPAERMIAGAVRIASPGGRKEFTEGALQYAGIAMSLVDATRTAAKALRMGDTLLDPGHLPVEQRSAITTRRLGTPSSASSIDPVSALVVDGLGTMIRMPSRFLMAEDEFFKQLTYRSRIRAEGLREGFSQYGLNVKKVAEHAEGSLRGKFDPVTGQALDDRHIRAAREVTFSSDLQAQTLTGGPTWGESLQKLAGNHPGLTLILPFIRTPTNIIRFAADRTPGLNMLRTQFRNDLLGRNGAEARGAAAAKMATGGALWATAMTYAFDGTVTGGGPADPQAKKELMQTGWRPYSFRITKEDGSVEYRAFDRLDPFGMFFGLAADMAEVSGFAGEREFEQLAMDATVALARNLQSKSYLSGLTRALGALAEPERRGERFVWGVAGSFVPSALNQLVGDDPHLREVRSIADAMRAKTPGLSQDVDPQRNILGEIIHVPPGWGPSFISPIAKGVHQGGQQPNTPEWRHTVQDNVHDEIARQLIIHGASIRPPSPEYGPVDMRDYTSPITGRSAYDRYLELTGTIKRNGRTLSESLEKVIKSDTYRNRATDGTFDHDGSRVDVLRRVLGEYRLAAMAELHREIPALRKAMRDEDFLRARTKVNR
ncbi:MAG TPA: hypothetical protein VNR89_04085 [Roseomonas sp.]|nr:hypothetical protein [Roseomonas sp.]